ncbi:MAG: divergent PAP2 family protein [Bacillota bacterium]|nr:divergent PAP2 family protein [Bacillota bacterium]
MKFLQELFLNKVLLSAVLSWIVAQSIKTLIAFIKTKHFDAKWITGSGGMPSGHTASVCALTTEIAIISGADSVEFALSFVLSAVVIYDSLNIRKAAGDHAKVLNKMILSTLNGEEPLNSKLFRELLGHKPIEVIAGALLGIVIALLVQ